MFMVWLFVLAGWLTSSLASTECPRLYNDYPVILLCHCRPKDLNLTLHSLLTSVVGVDKSRILAVQDGDIDSVAQVVQSHGIHLVQNLENTVPEDGRIKPRHFHSAKLTRHYKYALDTGFRYFNESDGLIIIEDDMLFSPDFLQYFAVLGPIVQQDPSLWIASAWNDNGFRGLVKDSLTLLRTDHFPGLGWLLLREVWHDIRPGWPDYHWDWYMRQPNVSRGRECVYPEVPRVFHAGWNGTFMDINQHLEYFARIDYNRDSTLVWNSTRARNQVLEPRYNARFIRMLLFEAIHVRDGSELSKDSALLRFPGVTFVVWLNINPDPRMAIRFKPISKRFGIWHQLMRGARKGVHEFWFGWSKIVLINVFDPTKLPAKKLQRKTAVWYFGFAEPSPWVDFKPPDARVFPNGRVLVEQMNKKL